MDLPLFLLLEQIKIVSLTTLFFLFLLLRVLQSVSAFVYLFDFFFRVSIATRGLMS